MSSRRIVYSHSAGLDSALTMGSIGKETRFRYKSKSYAVTSIIILMFRLPIAGGLLVFSGGRANIIHYVTVSAFIFLPMLYMFLFIGHYSKMGSMVLGRIVPLTHGIGYTMMFITCVSVVNEVGIAVDGFSYLTLTITSELPWMNCQHDWGDDCLGLKEMEECLKNETLCYKNYKQFSASKYKMYVLKQIVPGIDRDPSSYILNKIEGKTVLYLLICCLIILLVSDLTVTFNSKLSIAIFLTYVGSFLTFILIMAAELKNKYHLVYMFQIKWQSLVSLASWYDAMSFFVFMINTSNTGSVLLGSYLPLTAMADLTAFVAWIGIMFLYLLADFMMCCLKAALSQKMGTQLLNILVPSHAGVLILFPQYLGTLNFSPHLVCFIFFLLLTSSCIVRVKLLMACAYHTIADIRPIIKMYRFYIRIFSCVFLFILTMPMCVVDIYWLYNEFLGNLEATLSAMTMMIICWCVLYIYGTQTLCDDHHFAYGSQPATFFKITLLVVPVVLMAFAVYMFFDMAEYYNKRPTLAIVLYLSFIAGICLQIFGLLYISIYYLKRQNMAHLIRCEDTWGDPNSNTRKERLIYHPRRETNYFRRIDVCKHDCLRYKKLIVYIVKEEDVLHTEGYKMLHPLDKLFSDSEVGIA